MKKIGFTMKIDFCSEYNERRDVIDQKWYSFAHVCEFIPILLPNDKFNSKRLEGLSGIVLTGGNSLELLGGDASERDILENEIISYAIKSSVPVLGVCRGMQMIQNYFGVDLQPVQNHVAVRHNVQFKDQVLNVNSYHKYGATNTVDSLVIEAKSEDGVIEAIRHKILPIFGIMWHPEREQHLCEFDIKLFRDHFS